MPREQLDWVTINDFKPGIFDIPSPQNPPGTAQRDGTYRCIANHNGALVPLPAIDKTVTINNLSFVEPDSDYFIGGMRVNDPVFDGSTDKAEDGNNSEIWVGFEYFDGTDSEDRHLRVLRYKEYMAIPNWQTIVTENEVRAGLFEANYRPARCQFEKARSNQVDHFQAGTPVIVILYGDSPIFCEFPKDDASSTDTTDDLPAPTAGNPQPALMVAHQGRIVAFPLTLYGAGSGEVYPTNEAFYWTTVNDLTTLDVLLAGEFFNVIFGYENPTGYQCAASLTFNELLLLKSRGGGLALQGDLNNPTAKTLPNVMSPGHSNALGVQTPVGYAYPVQHGGVWVWGGGDTADNLSPQLSPNFWKPTDRVGPYGRPAVTCGMWREWLMVPNNWLFDTTNQGWWRIDNASVEGFHFDSDWTGQYAYAAPHLVEHDGGQAVLVRWNKAIGATSYNWRSHPFTQTMDREVEAREVVVVISGYGDVNLSLLTADDGVNDDVTFHVESDFPVAYRRGVSAKGYNLVVSLGVFANESEPLDLEGGAPTIHSIDIGLSQRHRVGESAAVGR